MTPSFVFITGGTGYIGRILITELLNRGHQVRALVRPGSAAKLPTGAVAIYGDALNRNTYFDELKPSYTFVSLVGVAHPGPAKKNLFRSIDLVAGLEAVQAAKKAKVEHFVYLSVAQPAPIMKSYVEVRKEVEISIREADLNASILRPWYVLGPGHWWPALLLPLYWIFENQSATRATAQRLGYVNLQQMVLSLVRAIETPARGVRIWEVPELRKGYPRIP